MDSICTELHKNDLLSLLTRAVAVLEGLPSALGVCARGPGAALIGALGGSFALFLA